MRELWTKRRQRSGKPRLKSCGIPSAALVGMTTMFLIVLAILAAGFITEMVAVANAPIGYQDEEGFHFGHEYPVSSDAFGSGLRK